MISFSNMSLDELQKCKDELDKEFYKYEVYGDHRWYIDEKWITKSKHETNMGNGCYPFNIFATLTILDCYFKCGKKATTGKLCYGALKHTGIKKHSIRNFLERYDKGLFDRGLYCNAKKYGFDAKKYCKDYDVTKAYFEEVEE